MSIANPTVDPVHVVQALVDTLLDVFDATRDLYETLTVKEQRDYEQNLRSKGYPASRRIEYVKDERLGSDEAIVTDKAVVTRQFDIGYQTIGVEFAEGDVIAHTALQSQIITLQSVLVTTFLYGPTSGEPIANQLASINTASRVAAATCVEILAALQERQQDERPLTPRSMHSFTARSSPNNAPSHVSSHHTSYVPSHAPSHHTSRAPSQAPSHHTSRALSRAPSNATSRTRSRAKSLTASHAPSHAPSYAPSHVQSHAPSRALTLQPGTTAPSSTSTALVKHEPRSRSSHMRSSSPVNTTVLTWRDNVEPEPSITDATSMRGPTLASRSNNLYCVYAYDLQRSPTQQLSPSITSDRDPYCPHCKGALHLSPGKAWEISKWAGDTERTFQVQNRFVVKCHRDGPDGQYCCVICSKYAESDTVCGDVKALIKHLSDDHDVRELKHEEDIVEVIEQPGSRRDSGLGFASSKGSRRSASLASGRRRKSLPAYDREVDVFDVRSSRR
ncbi:hypothetical protein CC77DRAFT_1004389 [Alternaria alternata]|uniref:Uncharacterized protein n=1 Tax=Alternaria alternata TaxID=5599 RepID=A0A177E4U0_ALTAL|nr:hypothetical protein CC77DRAFT_1004389 [Alternaria alternata]OAG26440.1 hypothetical protein CC77DRAFT_1004389 [Alternaria alternata]